MHYRILLPCSLLLCVGCLGNQGGTNSLASHDDPNGLYEPIPPAVYVQKAKKIISGLAVEPNEYLSVAADGNALRPLVTQWLATPEAQQKLLGFYAGAFQTTNLQGSNFDDQDDGLQGRPDSLVDNLQQSMARTAAGIAQTGSPWTETTTTHAFYMTTAMMAWMLANDQHDAKLTYYFEYFAQGGPATAADALDPNSPNFLHFPRPQPFDCQIPVLDGTGHVQLDANNKVITQNQPYTQRTCTSTTDLLGYMLSGRVSNNYSMANVTPAANVTIPADVPADKRNLYNTDDSCKSSYMDPVPAITADFNDWRLVTVRTVASNTASTPFYNLPALRQQSEIAVVTPRVGFLTHPAFLASYPTNESNQYRASSNQALIVALGRSINPVDKGPVAVLDTGSDGEHSDPSSPCFSCHQTLDPLRNVYARSFDYTYHLQDDANSKALPAVFGFSGVTQPMSTLDDFANILVAHPLYAGAWVQKLCFYGNSAACHDDDPEFIRLAQNFTASNYNFQTLLVDYFSSPLFTGARRTATWVQDGETISIARRLHLCASLSARLHIQQDLCTGDVPDGVPTTVRNTAKNQSQAISDNIATDGYARGAQDPVVTTTPSMFFRAAAEELCDLASQVAIDTTGSIYQSSNAPAALQDMVGNVMSISPTDPLAAPALGLLQQHQNNALQAGASATDALRSTFMMACLSPSALAIGL